MDSGISLEEVLLSIPTESSPVYRVSTTAMHVASELAAVCYHATERIQSRLVIRMGR